MDSYTERSHREQGVGLKRLNGMDAMLLYSETPDLHTHTLKVAVIDASTLDEKFDFARFRQTVAERLHLLDPLRYQLVDVPLRLHRPMWIENCDVDLDYHLRRVHVPFPGGRRELDDVIGRIASTPLDRTRPLWEFHFAEDMSNDRFALIGKLHHALADGVASSNLLARLLDVDQTDADPEPGALSEQPSKATLLRTAARDHIHSVAALPALVSDASRGLRRLRRRSRFEPEPEHADLAKAFDVPETFLNHKVSPVRTYATTTVALPDVKDTARCLSVTFNHVVLALVAGALRELMLAYDGSADRPILASVPISTGGSADRVSGNEISGLFVSLPVHVDDALERVRLTALAATRARDSHALFGPDLMGRMMSYLPPALAPAMFAWQGRHARTNSFQNVAVSNVPGPRRQGHIGGAPVTELYGVGVLSPGSAVNITVWSYVDQVDISVLSDDQTFRDVHELTDALIRSLGEIRSAAGLSELAAVPTAMPLTRPTA